LSEMLKFEDANATKRVVVNELQRNKTTFDQTINYDRQPPYTGANNARQ